MNPLRSTTTSITGVDTRDSDAVPTNSFGVLPREAASGSRAVPALVLGGLLFSSPLVGTAATAPISQVPQVRYIGEWTSIAKLVAAIDDVLQDGVIKQSSQSSSALTAQETVRWLHNESGLTWDQIGKVFGVSRRAVHMWANGARMNAANSELLAEFTAIVRGLDATDPSNRRAALLATRADGKSIIDFFRARRSASETPLSETSQDPERLLGARHDRPRRAT